MLEFTPFGVQANGAIANPLAGASQEKAIRVRLPTMGARLTEQGQGMSDTNWMAMEILEKELRKKIADEIRAEMKDRCGSAFSRGFDHGLFMASEIALQVKE